MIEATTALATYAGSGLHADPGGTLFARLDFRLDDLPGRPALRLLLDSEDVGEVLRGLLPIADRLALEQSRGAEMARLDFVCPICRRGPWDCPCDETIGPQGKGGG